ncbi:poly [ADP-ribose] polymerase tankyrase-2-like [Lytechinus pictus]|uniref:poly [ADP-ribose] polymerase tankyrase-2-like n=1 Tax=Lytechinus pictus TaxID=7653 RepID=UPI0030BA215C
MVKYLLDLSANVNKGNKTGITSLHIAASKGFSEIVGILLESAADVNAQDGPLVNKEDAQGKTPLHLAVEGGFSPVIEALVEFGANINIQTNDGKTCLHLAVTVWGSSDKTVQDTTGFEQVSIVHPEYQTLTTNEKLIVYLLDRGANYEIFDSSGYTPIHYACNKIWQLLVLRIPEEERSDALAALDHKGEDIRRSGRKVIGPEGGQIDLNIYNTHMMIPPGALDDDQEISIKLIEGPSGPWLREGEMLASFGVELKPGGLKFKKPVQIKLPHCARITDASPMQMVLYHCHARPSKSRDSESGKRRVQLKLVNLSKKMPHANYSSLCLRLGYDLDNSANILATHSNDYQKAFEEILRKWYSKKNSGHLESINKILTDDGLEGKISELFPDDVTVTQQPNAEE